MAQQFTLNFWSGSEVVANIQELASIYTEVYAEPPYNSGPLWSAQSFTARTVRQTARDGFSFVAAQQDGELAGFSFGLTFGKGKWWSGTASQPPEGILNAEKFAVIELVVRKDWRGSGIGRSLLRQLLAGRSEEYAILTAVPEAPARKIYSRWGWLRTGTAHHAPDAPIMDALLLPLDNVKAASPGLG
ncbi:GNAT family N-acetyltransferase [Actinoplanes sp. NPDC000266]